MTYFWVQMVHFGIRSMASLITTAKLWIEVEGEKGDFGRFLLLNPYIAKSDLWSEYYSKQVMMSKEVKEAMVLPDKKPLPNLVTQDLVDKIRMR
ncbi:hypothetical protein E1B28_000123 [Marasmius oreades]|uniref:Uncharacterized protein n=1 Tax=Marasmius oreades TaxID=181124 RepID=A0A9P7V0P5_9AGAR|nr:uncharacterized protein E1B28_000123 [Marasmius oreades]KAG7098153.1 hypothetical protein E1B28_000123 [Marasmius oreades]